ncbi:Uncharacterised protein [Legionella steigerwaltii]|uniref:Peptidase C39-like domain-containing protein n=1 Tax=Legionella steigerwaltii TaxID=460 RepID=A0A378LAJ2_9GAMM|nr:hypothetical protein [Legionella steigerwaltii]KTD75367.1 hypothetical protein Lstg_2542 [Legionella steigerwaltii]STY23724.1 Uncharacterised protein [Legionella steigerwaltii]
MPLITDFSQFIEEQVLKNNSGYFYKLGLPITPQTQRGQICKLNALSMVLNSLSNAYGMPTPLPIRKNKGEHSFSLRQLAKEKYGSQVGEVYSAKTLASIAEDNGYDNYTIYTEENMKYYVNRIVTSISKGEAPIIFYDVDKEGEPAQLSSNREHALVVAGYFINKNQEQCFIVCQWGKFYWVKAEDAFISTNQLSSCRTPENFYKYDQGWFDLYSTRFFPPETFANPPSESRKAHALPKEDGGLKNKILIIHAKPKPTNKVSFWSSPFALTDKESEKLFKEDLTRYDISYN